MIQRNLQGQGFDMSPNAMQVLVDDKTGNGIPDQASIINGLKWLTQGAKAGDTLFLHYSGHGTQCKNSQRKTYEAIIPIDYQDKGVIPDYQMFQLIVATLPPDVYMFVIMDCCHSGTVLDLPFCFAGTSEGIQQLQSGQIQTTGQNPLFNTEMALQLVSLAAQGILQRFFK